MAGLTREQKAERAAQDGDNLSPVEDGLVAMVKDGEELRIHPTCVQAHKESGWKVEE